MLLLRPYQVTNPIWVHHFFFFFLRYDGISNLRLFFLRPNIATREEEDFFLRPNIATGEEEEEAPQTSQKEAAAKS